MRVQFALAALVIFASGCTVRAAEPIKVGTIFPMSGPAGPSGIDASAGARVHVDLINKNGGHSLRSDPRLLTGRSTNCLFVRVVEGL